MIVDHFDSQITCEEVYQESDPTGPLMVMGSWYLCVPNANDVDYVIWCVSKGYSLIGSWGAFDQTIHDLLMAGF